MSTAEERHEIGRQLEQRGLVPGPAAQAAIRREAERLAQRVMRRRDTAAHRVLDLLARRDPADPDDDE